MQRSFLSTGDSEGDGLTCDLTGLAGRLLDELRSLQLFAARDWENLAASSRREIQDAPNISTLLQRLMSHGLVTPFQAVRIGEGELDSLIVGNYRLLDQIGRGGMGVVYQAVHRCMRRLVALKTFDARSSVDERSIARFFSEIEATAKLDHPNIVTALDAGETPISRNSSSMRQYLAMEYIPGFDLDQYVRVNGPLSAPQACEIAFQLASALSEAHRHGLVHRDVKPSNVRLTPSGQVKLLDFGLVRQVDHRLTEQDVTMGTVEYMAPEQARDAKNVDGRADIFGMGGTLFWCLSGKPPFTAVSGILNALLGRQSQSAPSLLGIEGVSPQLDSVVRRMLAADPAARFHSCEDVMRAIDPLRRRALPASIDGASSDDLRALPAVASASRRVLIVDDEPLIRRSCRLALEMANVVCEEAADGGLALEAVHTQQFDCVLLDVDMPSVNGAEVCRQLRADAAYQHLKIIMMSGRSTSDELAQLLPAGADDFLTKPLSVVQLQVRVKNALRLREAQERSDLLAKRLYGLNADLEKALCAVEGDLVHARNALVLALAKLVEHREIASSSHAQRMQRFSRLLAESAMGLGSYDDVIDSAFLDMIECCAPLHDIGKVALPDYILLKTHDLDPHELALMQTHTTAGADVLREVARQHPFAQGFLQMSDDIARHHHERYDGRGYPDQLAGDAIPLAARIVAICDAYDSFRARRPNKPALSHSAAVLLLTSESPGLFDPNLITAFEKCRERFAQVFTDYPD